MEREQKQSNYQMGVEFYQRKIDEAVAGITEDTSDFEMLTIIEEVERLELQMKQNIRRQEVLVEGKPINGHSNEEVIKHGK